MSSERTALLAIVTVALLAALAAAPAAAGEVAANGTLANDEYLTMATAGDTLPLPDDEPGLAAVDGVVTITVSGTGFYYLGDEITFSGTNTASDTTYLFLTGPNLGTNGVNLVNPGVGVVNGSSETFTGVAVEADDTWTYRWDTSSLPRTLDAGGYTIYAVSDPRSRDSLSGSRYSTVSIQLRSPTLSAQPSSLVLAPGDELVISGTATGSPPSLAIWVFGPNYYGGGNGALGVRAVSVGPDGTFECALTADETHNLQGGKYYVVVQHPVANDFDVNADPTGTGWINGPGIVPVRLTVLQAPAAANALICALDSPNVDDIYAKFSFMILEEGWILINPVSDQTYGEIFTVTGTTDYQAGSVLHYWIATKEANAFVSSGEAVVTDEGDWRIDLDTTAIGPGAFTLRVTAPDSQASATAVFDVYDEFIHPIPPGGAAYRVERTSINPSFEDLVPGTEVTLDGTIRAPWTGQHGNLEFSTDLEDPLWSCTIERDGAAIYTRTGNARSIMLTAFELDYGQEVLVRLSLSGTVPSAGSENPALLQILERDTDGRTVPNSEYRLSIPLAGDDPAPSPAGNLTLSPGWNFISIPRLLAAGNETAAIFTPVNNDGHSIFRYDTAAGAWIPLQKTDRLAPLEGYWIYSAAHATVPLNFSTDPLHTPAERALSTGWNAVGVTGTTPATARDTFLSVNAQWTTLIGFNAQTQGFETGIVNGGTGGNADTRSVYPGRGYWLYMTGPGTLCALGV